ncbi:MAG: addiction module toxin, HicA family [Candidatus Marinimicrobia bacterium]|nr:addiction module toxin, HicA family [Candidatus Neomarinimicrobiota bacterium]MBT6356474.1 addiction module toxin, HicA family [Chloroflexota bacterium]MBT6937375.1 addiction module toxin, HicA family [Candidatus Neomarinimicrobiota bacterium]
MPKQPRLKAKAAESLLFKHGFKLIRTKGSHRIYKKGLERIVIPFHAGKILHPKIVKQVFDCIGDK